ncbi:MAG: YlxR family protein [Eubacteriales bacterium]
MKTKKIPMRKCVGCMESKPKKELIRIVADKEGNLSIDLTGKAEGRGVYLCKDQACLAIARKKRSIRRSLEIEISEEKLEELYKELQNI